MFVLLLSVPASTIPVAHSKTQVTVFEVFVHRGPPYTLRSEIDEAISFLEKASSDRKELGAEAWWIGRMEVVSLKLKKGEYSAVKSQLEIAKSAMTGYEGMDPAVPATYYRVASEYYKVKATRSFGFTSSKGQRGTTDCRACRAILPSRTAVCWTCAVH